MNSDKHILYVEDDETLAFVTKDNLENHGYKVTHYGNGMDALVGFKRYSFDLCVLDIMLPQMDGFTLAEKIRKEDEQIPILFLSAKSMNEDRIKGFKIGGDDYITKPFSIEELILKIEVFLKRNLINKEEELSFYSIGKYEFHYDALTLVYNDNSRSLTQREADLLQYFARNQNKILKRPDILITVWGEDDYFLGRSLDVFISRLRKYLKDDSDIEIENIHGVGFRLNSRTD